MHWGCSAWPSAPLPEAVAAPDQPVCLSSPHCATLLNLTAAYHSMPPGSNPGASFPCPCLPFVSAASRCPGYCFLATLGGQGLPLEARGSFSHISKPLYPAQLCLLDAWLCVLGLVPFMTGVYVQVQPLQSKVQK